MTFINNHRAAALRKKVKRDLERDARRFEDNPRLRFFMREATKSEIKLDWVANGKAVADDCRLCAVVCLAEGDMVFRQLTELPRALPMDLPEPIVALIADQLSRVGPANATVYLTEALN